MSSNRTQSQTLTGSHMGDLWTCFWMRFAGESFGGRIASRLAAWLVPPYYGQCVLAELNPKGYINPGALIRHPEISLGKNVYIGDRVVIYNHIDGGPVELGDRVHLYGNTYIQTGKGGSLTIGRDTHIQPNCQFSAYKAAIRIGRDVQIAPGCAFYPYDHGILPGELICRQPLTTRGDITVGDDAWLGYGVIVLSGVRIGKGAVVGAGSVVIHSIPDQAIAAGAPARVIRMRNEISEEEEKAALSQLDCKQ